MVVLSTVCTQSAARRDPAGCERRDDRFERNPPQTAIPAQVPRGGEEDAEFRPAPKIGRTLS